MQVTINALNWALGESSEDRVLSQVVPIVPPLPAANRIEHSTQSGSSFAAATVVAKPQAATAVHLHSFHRFVERAENMDWRFKLALTALFALGVTLTFFLLRDWVRSLRDWGYVGAFVVNMVSNATIILPAPGAAIVALMAQDFNPLLIGIVAGIGGAIGGCAAYGLGAINSHSIETAKRFGWLRGLMRKAGAVIIFVFALVPMLPGDVASVMAGGSKYPFARYLLISGAANVVKMTVIAYLGARYLTLAEQIARNWVIDLINTLWQWSSLTGG